MARQLLPHDPPPAVVAARIRAERERLGYSQIGAAEAHGGGRLSYRQLEVAANPRLTTLVRLVRSGYSLRAIAPELFEGEDRG